MSMRTHSYIRDLLATVGLGLLIGGLPASGQGGKYNDGAQVRTPNWTASPIFKGKQGPQRTEIDFDPASRIVTIKFLVQDPNHNFIPNIRPNNFVLYEDGVRQPIDSVEVEHAPVSIGLLVESGGRS